MEDADPAPAPAADDDTAFCNEAISMIRERHNLPSRQRDNTIVRFAQQFINNVEMDDADLDNFWLQYDEEDVDNFDAATDFLEPVDKESVCEDAISILLSRLKMGDRTIVQFAKKFIRNVKNDIFKTFTDTRTEEEGYNGLDSDRDTEDEVEAAIRCCPEVLARKAERYGYPIKCLTIMRGNNSASSYFINTKAVAFVPLFARLAIEFHVFEEDERGGLLTNNRMINVLKFLVEHSHAGPWPRVQIDEQQQERLDTTLLAVLTQLRQLNYFVKDDIQEYNLVHGLCKKWNYFAQHRFRFLIEWDPSSLLQTEGDLGTLPIHYVTNNLRSFRVVLDSVIRFYPRWKGINTLFQKTNSFVWRVPFELACDKLTRAAVMNVVEETLVRYTTNDGLVNDNFGNAMILAATDNRISLDGLFFLIQRQPNSMLSMLRHRNNNNNNRINTNNTGNTNHVDNGSNDNHNNGILRGSARKRKRN